MTGGLQIMNAIEIARKMETDAIKFYTEVAQKVKYPAGKEMFETIIVDEKKHLEIVNKLLKSLDVSVEDLQPMKDIKTVFENMKEHMMEKVEVSSDELEAFKIAMQMEKEGLEFYKKLSSESTTSKEKAVFDRLVSEEQKHYDIFSNSYNFLEDTGNWFMWEDHSIVEG
jgi:rubrerythrin